MEIKTDSLEWKDAYKLLQGSVLPRPIAFVSSQDENGTTNLAPFSFFTVISANPMMVCFSPMRRGTDGAKKDTLNNIEATKQFVINIVSEDFIQQMNDCATEFPSDVDEFEASGLTKTESAVVKPPRVRESRVHLECELNQVLHFGQDEAGAGSLVIGKVVHVHVDDDLYENGRINSEKLNPVGRLAGATYTLPLARTFELQRK
ncbi:MULTISPECIES: flavin reductase family protein [unclassified Mesobacillus]|uniref:flavin reductase family protein n=1 Tax=unclassified Mesobacillus TaxID=2675270 RepID=UPI002041FB7D|nr:MULTISPECIES: flavin reductase family protein [unclassified Mesobacillus]MCM3123170.1 flavin reductase family protein [Mesobacillus sp. MER 33]MCM3233347.1 flavin reductase family protein [Mesobacillus sp. MER 48]